MANLAAALTAAGGVVFIYLLQYMITHGHILLVFVNVVSFAVCVPLILINVTVSWWYAKLLKQIEDSDKKA